MKILVLAGGYDQIALINELKSRGHEVYLADYLDNPPAKKYVIKHFQLSTLDENAILCLAKRERFDLITTACTDQALLTAASVSEKLELPCYISAEIAKNVTNKAYMKKIFFNNGIPTANCSIYENKDIILKKTIDSWQYPLIVKPCDCNSSKGVQKVNNMEELLCAVDFAFTLSRDHKVIVEEYKEGIEVSIDVWKDSEDVKILSISKTSKVSDKKDDFLIYQSNYPVILSDSIKKKIYDIAKKICCAFALENCPILIQAIINSEDISVLEFSARMGGGSKYKLIEYMSGINIMKVYTNRILGDVSQIVSPISSVKNIELDYVYAYNGIFDKIMGADELLNLRKIKELFQYKVSGNRIEKMSASSDRVFGFLLEEDSTEELNKRRKEVVNTLDILDKNGHSIMFKNAFKKSTKEENIYESK